MVDDDTPAPFAATIAMNETALAGLDLSSSRAPMSAEPTKVGGRYEILGLLGTGGMGRVYRARDIELDEEVALKMLRREIVDSPGILDRFRREVKLARRVTHKNVARTFDIGEHEGDKFLTMEFIDGESLATVLTREVRISSTRIATLLDGLCAGLTAAHEAGVIHRDLKPDNVLLAKDGRVVITDFGIARACESEGGAEKTMGLTVGTPSYMAPEQVEAKADIDARADVYALGAMLYEMLVGERAWQGESPIAVAAARLVHPPPDPRIRRREVSEPLALVILRAMARSPADRYPTAIALRDDFAAAAAIGARLNASTPPPAWIAHALAGGLRPSVPIPPASGSGTRTTGTMIALAQVLPRASDKGVAVLPFHNGGPAEDEYLAEGLTDDLIDSLSMTPGLRVTSRGAVARYKGARDAREVGRELNVEVVVEGAVRRAGGAVRVNARVIGVVDGFQLWAKRFDRPEADVLVINDEAARAIASALTVDLSGPMRQAPTDPLAVDLYLRARSEYRRFWREHVRKALGLFAEAHARAPEDPLILAGYAMAAVRLWFFGGEGSKDAEALAKEMAAHAVAVAPHLGEAHLAMASVFFHDGDARAAIREVREALARSPALAEAHALLGRILLEVDGVENALRSLDAALSLDPETVGLHRDLSRAYGLSGDWVQADAMLERSLPVEGFAGVMLNRARSILWRKDVELAKRGIAEINTPEPGPLLLAHGLFTVVVTGVVPVEIQSLRAFLFTSDGGHRRRVFFLQVEAELLAFVGRLDDALGAIGAAVDAGLIDIVWLDSCPLFDVLRDRPELPVLRSRVAERAREAMKGFFDAR